MPEKQLILVTGMHRSGTSVLTRVLNLLGAEVGKDLLQAQADVNARGFWEHKELVAINEALLEALGRRWYDFQPLADGRWAAPKVRELQTRAQSFLSNTFDGVSLAALKDPRLCLTLPFWKEAAEALGWQPLVVLALRAPWEVAASLCRRDPLDTIRANLLWLRYVRESECNSRNMPRASMDYARLLADWRPVVRHVEKSLGLSWPLPMEQAATEVDAEIDPGLRHQHSSFQGESMPLVNLAAQAYELLREENPDTQKLDLLWDEFESLLAGAGPLAHGLQVCNASLFRVNNEWHELGDAHQQALDTIAEKDMALSGLAKELEYARKIVEERDRQLQQMAAELEHAGSVVEERDQQLQQANLLIEQVQEELEHLRSIRLHPVVKLAVKLLALEKKQ
ncbi:hypothetical protein [Thiolapillus sp.]